MTIRIAIPEPTTSDAAYNARSLPPYLAALQSSGALPVIIPLHERQDRVARLLAGTQGVLLPGSGFDVDPERYGEARLPVCGPADTGRTAVDELLLQDAFNLHKPILAICHGCQTLNVWLNGTLIQDIETALKTPVNHAPGRDVINAHPLHITAHSRLANIATAAESVSNILPNSDLDSECNSSHHQAVNRVGDNLRVTAISPQDGVIEAIELDSPDHFAVGVQWHPERTYTASPLSRALFTTFVRAAEVWRPRSVETSVAGA
jgi:putative glutamine amidotransferase